MKFKLINTFDLEPWWSSVPNTIPYHEWNTMEDRSQFGLDKFLNICDEHGINSTVFVLGWYAQKYPDRVREIRKLGHEIGCHSLFHEDLSCISHDEFKKTTLIAKNIIEDSIGESIHSYRAPSFSIVPKNLVIQLEILYNLGFIIDSSISTAARIYGGGFSDEFSNVRFMRDIAGVNVLEIPSTGVKLLNKNIQVFGGGYLRVVPEFCLKHIIKKQTYQVLYIHAHDFDNGMPFIKKFGFSGNIRKRLSIGDLSSKLNLIYKNSVVTNCIDEYKLLTIN